MSSCKRALFVAILLPCVCHAQVPEDYNYNALKQRFPKESFVKLNVLTLDEFDIGKDGLNLTTSYHEKIICLDENAVILKKRSIGYDSFSPILELDATLYYPNQGKYKVEKVKSFDDKAVIDGGMSFYKDYRERSFEFENIREGALIDLKIKRQSIDEHLISGRQFEQNIYADKTTYRIKVHKDIKLGFFEFNMDNSGLKHSEWSEGNYTYHQWEKAESKKELLYGDNDYESHYWPQVVPYIQSYEYAGEVIKVLQDTGDLYNWYRLLVSKVSKSEAAELKEIADSLAGNFESEIAKVKSIYQWVQDNIKYIAFSDGYGGFIPRDPDLILQRRFGDCKDMSCLIVSMLDAVGIESHLTWVGTREIPYSYSDLPSPVVDNHMIVTYLDSSGTPYILDATNSNLKFGRASYSVQGKEAMVALTDSAYRVIKLPIIAAKINLESDTVKLSIKGDVLIGNGQLLSTGYDAEYIHSAYMGESTEKGKRDLLFRILKKGTNKFLLGDYQYHWPENVKDSLRITYNFSIESYLNIAGENCYVNLNLDKNIKQYRIPENRKMSSFYRFLFAVEKTFLFEIPENAEVMYIPENAYIENDLLAGRISYSIEGRTIKYQIYFEHKALEITPSQKEEWNNAIGFLSSELDRSIKLKYSNSDD